jgi:hypothetical protein
MALSNQDRVLESSSTTGTGAYTLAGAVTGFQSFAIVGNANTVQYSAWEVDASGNPSGGWENGLGTYASSGTTLARTTIYTSSNSNAAVNWSAGTRYIACSPLTEGTLVVRQPGGTVGTDEVQVSHDGNSGSVDCKDGVLNLKTSSNGYISAWNHQGQNGGNYYGSAMYVNVGDGSSTADFKLVMSSNSFGSYGAFLGLASASRIFWSSNSGLGGSESGDVGLKRAAAGVIATTDSMTGTGWIQNSAGEAALESAFTRSDATLTSTNLSLTVIAGRSYRITGYLIVSNSVAGEGAKFDFDGGTATRTTFDVTFNAVGGTVVPGTIAATALDTDLNYTSVTGTTRIFVQGYLEVNAGGTFILRASEDSTVTGTMTLAAGSWLALADTVDK